MWYKLLIAYLLAFPALITGLYLGDRAWRSPTGGVCAGPFSRRRRPSTGVGHD